MVRHAAAGELTVDHEVPPGGGAEGVEMQAAFPRRKLVLQPEGAGVS